MFQISSSVFTTFNAENRSRLGLLIAFDNDR